jgi:hypothetical protein
MKLGALLMPSHPRNGPPGMGKNGISMSLSGSIGSASRRRGSASTSLLRGSHARLPTY